MLTLNHVHLITDPQLPCIPHLTHQTLALTFLGLKNFLTKQKNRKSLRVVPSTIPEMRGPKRLTNLTHPSSPNNANNEPLQQLMKQVEAPGDTDDFPTDLQ
jgi:hypothetical protein